MGAYVQFNPLTTRPSEVEEVAEAELRGRDKQKILCVFSLKPVRRPAERAAAPASYPGLHRARNHLP